ncbi:hypothetical protein GCM10027072_24640 [Streptomyces bullii]
MLAIASLATGFVVAAVTPSHAVGEGLGGLNVDNALGTLDKTLNAEDGLSLVDDKEGKPENKPDNGKGKGSGKPGKPGKTGKSG